MFKGFFTALSSKVFGAGQGEARGRSEEGDGNSSSNATKEKSKQASSSTDPIVVSTDPSEQKKENLKEASTDVIVPKPDGKDRNNSGSDVTNEDLSASVINTKSKNDTSGQETSPMATEDQVKGEVTGTKSDDAASPTSGGNGQDMSEWVTLEMPKGKRSPRNRKTKSPKNQKTKSPRNQDVKSSVTPDAVSVTSEDHKSLLDSGNGMTERASSLVETGDGMTEKASSLVETGDGTTQKVSSLVETGDGTTQKVSSLVETGDGMTEKASSLVETGDGTMQKASSLVETGDGTTQKVSSLVETGDGMTEKASSPVEKGDKGDGTTQKASTLVEITTPESKCDERGQGSEAAGDARGCVETKTGHLDEDSYSSMLVSSVLEEIVGQMSEVTVKDTTKDNKAEDTNQGAKQDKAKSDKPQDDNWRAKGPNRPRDQANSGKPQDNNWRAKGPNRPGGEYCKEKPQRGKKGMRQRSHKQGYSDDKSDPPHAGEEQGEEKEISEERKKLPPIDPNLEKEDFLKFCKMHTEHDKLMRAKKLIYKLGYLKDVPQDEIREVILGQYKIAARRSVHSWIEDARYYSEVMISSDWIDNNLLHLNPRLNKKTSNKRTKNRYMENEDSFGRKTGGMCQDVRLLTNPNLTVVRVNMKSNGNVEKAKGDETTGDGEGKVPGSSGEKLGKTGKAELKTTKDQDDQKEDGPTIEVDKDDKEKSTAECPKDDGEDQFEDCLEESVKKSEVAEDEKKESGSVETSAGVNSSEAVEEEGKPVEQGGVTEVVALIEECLISPEEQDVNTDPDKDVQKDSELREDCGDEESEKQLQELVASNDSFTDPAIIMMVKSSDSDAMPDQPSYGMEMPAYDPKCDVLSGLFRIEEDPRSLIETIMHSDSPTEPLVTQDYPQPVMMSHDDPTMVMENDSQLIDYLLNVTEESKNPTMLPGMLFNDENSNDSLAELEGIEDFLTHMVTNKVCSIDDITDIDTAGIGDGGFGEEVVNLDLVKDESVMKLLEQCRTEDLAEGVSCDGAGEAPALEGQVLEEVESKKSIQHVGDPVESEMVYNLLQDLPISHQEGNAGLKQDCIDVSADPDHQVGNPAGDEYKEAVVDGDIQGPTVVVSDQDEDIQGPTVVVSDQDADVQVETELVESHSDKEPYSPTQGCVESYSPTKSLLDPDSLTQNLTEAISPSLDK